MSRAEDVLYLSLTDIDRLETLALIGLAEEAIPAESMRPVVKWAIDEFYRSGRKTAPSREAMLETWGTVIDDARIELLPEDEDADTTEWAIEQLKSQYVWTEFQDFTRNAVKLMASASELERVPLLGVITDQLNEMNMSLQNRQRQLNAAEGFSEALSKYEARTDDNHVRRGMFFGMPMVDDHTNGIHPGEIAMLAAGPKTGKSWFLNWVALREWERGRRVVLYTLENSVEMVYDRMACMHTGVSYRAWQRGQCTPEEIDRMKAFTEEAINPDHKGQLHVIMPDEGDRTMQSMVRRAHTLGAQSLLIDQLSFVEIPESASKQRLQRDQVIALLMRQLKTAISMTGEPLPVLMAHQVNREGVKLAKKLGYLQMEHMAEGSEVERTADWVLGLYQSTVQRQAGEAMLQVMASRREDVNQWDMTWEPSMGLVSPIREAVLEQ